MSFPKEMSSISLKKLCKEFAEPKEVDDGSLEYFLRKEWVTLLSFLVNAIAFYACSLHANHIDDLRFLVVAYKVIPILCHVIPIVMVATLYLWRKIGIYWFGVLLGISRGYIVYDTCIMFTFPELQEGRAAVMLYTLHHMLFFCITYYIPKHASYIAVGLLSEIANIPLNYIFYCYENDPERVGTGFFKVVVVIMFMTYFLFRVVNFCFLSYGMIQKYRQKQVSRLESVLLLPLCIMNCVWFLQLVSRAIEEYCL